MTSTNNIKNLINPNNLGYSEGHTNLCDDGKTYEFFKLESDGYVYVLCVDSNRATRYNGEGQNGKRISMDAYLTARETLDSEANIKELGGEIDPISIAWQEAVDNGEIAEDEDLSIEAVEDDEIEEIAKKMKKTRKSKDIAYTYSENGETVVTLTAKQVDFVKHLSDTCFWENGLESCVWVDCLCDEIGGQFAGKPMTVGAMISTLCEKGLGIRAKQKVNGRKCTSFELTDLGMKVFAGAEWGLE